MPIQVIIKLTETEQQTLETIIKKGSNWRERDRAMTIKLLHEGMSTAEIAKQQGHHVETIRQRRRRWQKEGFASLPEPARSGAPRKLSEEDLRLLKQWVMDEALTSRMLLKRLKEERGVEVSDRCLHKALKRLGFVWKRTRYSLKKKRDEQAFAKARQEIEQLIERAQKGEIELAYVDEAGFMPQPPNRLAWTARGDTHCVTAKRGRRLNLIGALFSSGKLLLAKLWRSVTGLHFFAFLMAMVEKIRKPLVVILDNASIHTSKKLKPYWEMLEEKGMKFYFLPPYSPDMNRIEILWRKMKYEGLPFKQMEPEELENEIGKISKGFGTEYNMTFF